LASNKIGRQRWQPIILIIRRAIDDGQVAALDITTFAQTFLECSELIIALVRSGEQADHRHRRLLRTRCERPHRRTADKRDVKSLFGHRADMPNEF
jgi:hypothetical protein